jgi:DNA-directed RNA polymerase alpha subunit
MFLDEADMPRRRLVWEKARPSDLVIRSNLPQWVVRVLREGGIKRMSVITALSDEQLLQIPGIGTRSVTLIREELHRINTIIADPIERLH